MLLHCSVMLIPAIPNILQGHSQQFADMTKKLLLKREREIRNRRNCFRIEMVSSRRPKSLETIRGRRPLFPWATGGSRAPASSSPHLSAPPSLPSGVHPLANPPPRGLSLLHVEEAKVEGRGDIGIQGDEAHFNKAASRRARRLCQGGNMLTCSDRLAPSSF